MAFLLGKSHDSLSITFVQGEGYSTNQKGNHMKKSTLASLVAYLNGESVVDFDAMRDAVLAEYNATVEKAKENTRLYEAAHDVVMKAMAEIVDCVTVKELYGAIADDLPEKFSQAKLQYAMGRMWTDEVESIDNGRNAKTYRLKRKAE